MLYYSLLMEADMSLTLIIRVERTFLFQDVTLSNSGRTIYQLYFGPCKAFLKEPRLSQCLWQELDYMQGHKLLSFFSCSHSLKESTCGC